jgi:hypothetical protein
VNSISDLLSTALATPSTSVRTAARKSFATMQDYYDVHCPSDATQSADALSA